MFQEYVAHGWYLCPIKAGEKGPRSKGWNEKESAITDAETAGRLRAAGLCHAYSGTCAFDIDDLTRAIAIVPEVVDWFLDPNMVRIDSGRPNRAKFLFALSEPLPSKTFANGAFELRCGTTAGRTAQDVLPPSPHPSGTTYKWVGDWRNLPPLPDVLRALWLSELSGNNAVTTGNAVNPVELEALVSKRDPSCGYTEWIKIGMAVHHETEGSEEGFALWDNWSNKSDKYPGIANLRTHWQSFGRSATPVTADSLCRTDTATPAEFDFLSPEQPAQLSPFRFLSLPELFARPEPDWLIQDILPQRGLGSFWGQPGSGKTFLAVDIALAVAMQSHWRGMLVKRGGKVLYIAAEDDTGVQVRFASGLNARGARDAAVRVLPVAPVFTSPKQSEALLQAIAAEGKPALTVVDTLAAVTPGTDENSGKDMGPLIAFCQKIVKLTGGVVVLVHHEGKTVGKGPRGWSGLHGAFDVEWAVTDEQTHREMRIAKMKSAPTGSSFAFQLLKAGKSCVVEWI